MTSIKTPKKLSEVALPLFFSQMVNNPGYQQGGGFNYGVNKRAAEIKREKLFAVFRDLVIWEVSKDHEELCLTCF